MATENKTTTSSQSQGSSSNSGVSTQSSTPAASSSKPATSSVTPLPQVNVSIPKIDAPVSPQNTEAAYAQRLNSGALKQNPLQVNTSQLNIPNIAGGQEQEQEEAEKKYAQRLNAGGLKAAQPTKAATEQKQYPLQTLYQNMVKPEDYGQPTEAQLEEERKRNKRNALLATIGDGLAAFHKAYSHARGVKPMELENLSDKMYNRLEKIRKERQANKLAYQNARLRAAGLDQQAQINFERQQRELDRMKEAKRHNEAMEAESRLYHDYLMKKDDANRQFKKEENEANRESKERLARERNYTSTKNANIRHSGSGGKGKDDDFTETENKKVTKTDKYGNQVTEETSRTKQKVGGKGKARPKITF